MSVSDALTLTPAELSELHHAHDRAVRLGHPAGLMVLGYGEMSVVTAFPAGVPRMAIKSLPRFPTPAELETYARLVDDYLLALAIRGVLPAPSRVVAKREPDGRMAAYMLQPLLESEEIAHRRLVLEPHRAAALLAWICGTVAAAIDARVGLDAGIDNWALVDGELVHIDVTTPWLRDEHGHDRLDLGVFLTAYPWALRRVLQRIVLPGVVDLFRDCRGMLLELCVSLLDKRLDDLLPTAVAAANEHIETPIGVAEVKGYYRRDARIWTHMQRPRRLDRTWQRAIRRRPYAFLLPAAHQR